MNETLSLKERIEHAKVCDRGRRDPVWFLKEIVGWQSMYPMQEDIIRTFYQHKYDSSLPKYKKLIARCGQRSGKTVLGSKIAVYEFFELVSLDNPALHFGLLDNQQIGINCIAAGKEIALEGMFSIMRNDINDNEWFNQWYDINVTEGKISVPKKNIYAKVAAAKADSGAGTGTTSKMTLLDETDLFQRTDSKVGSEIVISKALNSTQTLGLEGKFVAISSTQYVDGAITKLYNEGLEEPNTLTYNLPTWDMNPNMKRELLEEEYKYKMDAFWRDFANEPNVSGGSLFPDQNVRLNRNIPNCFEIGYIPDDYAQFYHVMAVDPAFRNDSFGVAIGFRDGDHIVIDGVTKFQKDKNAGERYIKPSDIENFIFKWFSEVSIEAFIYDTDLILSTVEKLETRYGLPCIKQVAGEEAYGKWVTMNDGGGELGLDITYNEFLRREANQLIKVQLPSKVRIDHPHNGSKDSSDAVAQCIWYLSNNMSNRIGSKPVIMMRRF